MEKETAITLCKTAIQNGADAIAAAYIFHFSQYTPDDIKNELNNNNINNNNVNLYLASCSESSE